ncbi:MAG: hypothetical protein ACJAVK_000352 [Akkermansiaceae bacterium]|jgi:hypothetical protein
MKLPLTFAPLIVFVIASSFLLVGCFEDEEAKLKDLEDELKILAFDEKRAREFLVKAQEELAGYEKARSDLGKTEVIGGELEKLRKELEGVTKESDELKASLESTLSEFEQSRADHRIKIRQEIIGKEVDLSEAKGEGYESVRVLSVTPLEIRIYTSSGPQSVPVESLPTALKESLEMDEQEGTAFREKQAANAELRAQKYEDWKKGLTERKEETAQKEIVQRLKNIQSEINGLEKKINLRTNKIMDLTSRASQWERNWAKENNKARRAKAEKYYQHYRDQAQLVTDENSNTYLVIFRLRAEMEDLKAMKNPGK